MNHRTLSRVALIVTTAATCACSSPTSPSNPPGAGPTVPTNVSCSAFPISQSSEYVLPYAAGERFMVSRTFGHYLPSNGGVGLYAIDLLMPMGTPVLAIRAGTTVGVEERFSDDDHADYHENFVMVRHADGTVARYIHLMMNGAEVSIGDTVVQGQVIGRSGNSGASLGPHLHFDVQSCGPNLPPRYNDPPCGMTLPLSFRNTEPQTCGLEARKSYVAMPFTPESR